MSTSAIQPVIIVQPGAMSKRDMAKMNKAGITVVEAKNPQNIRFLDPPRANYTVQERAAIALCRKLLTNGAATSTYYRQNIAEMWVEALIKGGSLDGVEPVTVVPSSK